jgi:hypothetical protein
LARLVAGAWAAAIVVGLGVGAVGPRAWQAALVDGAPACPLRAGLGVPCPFCGMTHATVALGGGRWGEALGAHPAAPLVIIALFSVAVVVASGRGPALARGRTPYLILAAIAVVWVVRATA